MDTGAYTGFDVELSETGVATVTLNRPESLNSLSRELKRDFIEMIQQAQMDRRVRVVVFTGAGNSFVAGDDMSFLDRTPPTKVPPLSYGKETPQFRTYDSLRTVSQMVVRTIRQLDKL